MLGESHLRVLDPLGLLDELSLVRLDRLELLQQRLVEDLDGDLARVAWVEAPPQLVAVYQQRQPEWCKKKQTLAAMVSVADNVTAQIVDALTEQAMW